MVGGQWGRGGLACTLVERFNAPLDCGVVVLARGACAVDVVATPLAYVFGIVKHVTAYVAIALLNLRMYS